MSEVRGQCRHGPWSAPETNVAGERCVSDGDAAAQLRSSMQTVALVRQAERRCIRPRLVSRKPIHRGAAKIKKGFDSLASLPYTTTTDGAAALSGR
jgi:hypothetical protein